MWEYFRERLVSISMVSVSQETQNVFYNSSLVLSQMAYFPDFIYLDSYRPLLLPHRFPNTPIIKDKSWVFSLLKLRKFFIITFSINISVFFSNTINCILLNILKFWKGKSVTWDDNSVTCNDFQSMITSGFSLKLCKLEKTQELVYLLLYLV